MENNTIDLYSFIEQNIRQDPSILLLSHKKPDFEFNFEFAVTQIQCRRKYSEKLKKFISNRKFLFPDTVSAEQATHQAVAKFHSLIIQGSKEMLDMTAGLGIDTFCFSSEAEHVTSVELNPKKAEILKKNILTLEKSNISVINEDSIQYLKNSSKHFDFIFIDPSRRDSANNRVYNFKDCSPDVIYYQNLLTEHSKSILIKGSPLLDITQTLKDLKYITAIYAIGVKGECKELLIEINRKKSENNNSGVETKAINLDSAGNIIFEFNDRLSPGDSSAQSIAYASVQDLIYGHYILEPSSMIMKLAPWSAICERFNAKKLDKSSNIFVSPFLHKDFPGRVTMFDKFLTKQDRKSLSGLPASIISRNHPLSSESLRKSFHIKEGDNNFIYATRVRNKPLLFMTRRV